MNCNISFPTSIKDHCTPCAVTLEYFTKNHHTRKIKIIVVMDIHCTTHYTFDRWDK